jgi:lipoprotein-releasing system permease protein
MSLPFKIARRYLFARRHMNAINVITGISVFGLALGSAALILVLSVFNGFEALLTKMMHNFNPDVKITAAVGKTFQSDSLTFQKIAQTLGVEQVSETLEELAFFEYNKSQTFGTLKGVDAAFSAVNGIDTTLQHGVYKLTDSSVDCAILGMGMRNQLGVYERDALNTLSVYMPKREEVGALEQPFRKLFLQPVGAFSVQQEFDNQYIIASLGFVQELLNAPNEVSSYEIKVKAESSAKRVATDIQKALGGTFRVRDRYQQDEAFLKLVNIEKWMSYAILSLTLLLVAFNMVGSLWMIVLEKRADIVILKAMGGTNRLIRHIFLSEGLLMCVVGLLLGFALAFILYLLHVNMSGGLVPLPEGFATDRYPVALKLTDFFWVALTVCIIGTGAALPAALRAEKIETYLKEE